MATNSMIPVLLLKTRSQPHDGYEEYFSALPLSDNDSSVSFEPVFVPVLEHKQDEPTLRSLGELLKNNELKGKYGGMIFTSQRAVEGWADTVMKVEKELQDVSRPTGDGKTTFDDAQMDSDLKGTYFTETATDSRSNEAFTTDVTTSTPFPLYTVGPATSRALATLLEDCARSPTSPFTRLRPEILGAHTGNGASLAKYMLNHYNTLHSHRWFTYYEAPRLPFIPLLGMGSENYSRKRLEETDPRLQKKPLLFLVGEQRRDIIPRTLMDPALGDSQIEVEEVEVYSTVVKEDFTTEFSGLVQKYTVQKRNLVIVVVFSPQGSDTMLRSLGYIDEQNNLTDKARRRWHVPSSSTQDSRGPQYIIATIGPTTRDHLIDTFEFEPDVCAAKPTAEALGQGIAKFLKAKGLS